jgi:hypothetical protein
MELDVPTKELEEFKNTAIAAANATSKISVEKNYCCS